MDKLEFLKRQDTAEELLKGESLNRYEKIMLEWYLYDPMTVEKRRRTCNAEITLGQVWRKATSLSINDPSLSVPELRKAWISGQDKINNLLALKISQQPPSPPPWWAGLD